MIFGNKRKVGDLRILKKHAWLPILDAHDRWIWFEEYYVLQEYQSLPYYGRTWVTLLTEKYSFSLITTLKEKYGITKAAAVQLWQHLMEN